MKRPDCEVMTNRSRRQQALLVCFTFAPAHMEHMRAYAEGFGPAGFDVSFLVSEAYRDDLTGEGYFLCPVAKKHKVSILLQVASFMFSRRAREMFAWVRRISPTVVFFEMSHPLNVVLLAYLRIRRQAAKTLVYLHEPATVSTKLRQGFPLLSAVLVNMTQWLELRLCDFGVVSSKRVQCEAMRATGMPQETLRIANLLYPSRRTNVDEHDKREWIVFLGRATEERGIRDFLDYACFLRRRGMRRKLAILTRDNLDRILASYDKPTLASVEIRHGAVIPEAELDTFLRQAICCVLPSRVDVMQSGIPGTVYARGCALVVTAAEGVREYVVHGRTGIILGEKPATPEDIEEAVCAVQAGGTSMAGECRRYFDEHFGSGAFRRYYGWLLDDAEQPSGTSGTGRDDQDDRRSATT